MKKALSLALTLIMIVSVFCGCDMEQNTIIEKDGKCTVEEVVTVPKEEWEEYQKQMEQLKKAGLDSEEGENPFSDDQFKLETIGGKEYYVARETNTFSSYKKYNKYLKTDGNSGCFESAKLSDEGFKATMVEGANDSLMGMTYKVKFTFPKKITYTNGKLSADKKTVTFNIAKYKNEIYALYKKPVLKISKATPKKGRAYIRWTKVAGAKKYTLSYKLKTAKKWKSVSVKGASKTVKKLEKGKKYNFKVTCKANKKNFKSKIKTVKIKK